MAKREKMSKDERYTLKGSSFWGMLLFAVLIIVDLLTKLWADVYFNTPGKPARLDVLPGWLSLCIEYNPGMAFGAGGTAKPWQKILVILLTAVIMVGLAVAYFKIDKRRSLLRLALVFIVAGGLGNLIDRVYYRVWETSAAINNVGVRDMVSFDFFHFVNIDFPICNFADFFITGGAVMLILAMVFFDRDAIFPVGKKYRALAKEYEALHPSKDKEKKEEDTNTELSERKEENNG